MSGWPTTKRVETLFDMRTKVDEIHAAVSNRRTTMKKRKKTPEERAAERARSEDLNRRLVEMIERYRLRIEQKRAAES